MFDSIKVKGYVEDKRCEDQPILTLFRLNLHVLRSEEHILKIADLFYFVPHILRLCINMKTKIKSLFTCQFPTYLAY